MNPDSAAEAAARFRFARHPDQVRFSNIDVVPSHYLSSLKSQAIAAARTGSYKDFAIVSGNLDQLPLALVPGAVRMMLNKLDYEDIEINTESQRTCVRIILGLGLVRPHLNSSKTLVSLLKENWARILACMQAIHAMEKFNLQEYQLGEDSSVGDLLSVALSAFFLSEDLGKFISRDHSLFTFLAQVWLRDDATYLASKALADGLFFSNGKDGLDKLLHAAEGLPENVTGVAFLRLRASLKNSPVKLSDITNHLGLITTFLSAEYIPNPIGRTVAERHGAYHIAQAFSCVMQRPFSGTAHERGRCIESFIMIFRNLLLRDNEGPDSCPRLEAIRGNFLQSIAFCHPILPEIEQEILSEMHTLLSHILSQILVLRSAVIASMKSLEDIPEDVLRRIRRSKLGDSWMAYERLLLERLICLRISARAPDVIRCFNVSQRD